MCTSNHRIVVCGFDYFLVLKVKGKDKLAKTSMAFLLYRNDRNKDEEFFSFIKQVLSEIAYF